MGAVLLVAHDSHILWRRNPFPFAGGPGGGVFFSRAYAGLAWLARVSLAVVVLEIDEPAAPRILKHVPMAGFTHDIVTVCRKDSQVVNSR